MELPAGVVGGGFCCVSFKGIPLLVGILHAKIHLPTDCTAVYPKRLTHDVILQPFPDFVFEKYRLCRGFLSVIEAHLCPLTNRLYDWFPCPASMGLQNTRQQLEPKCSLDKSEYALPQVKKETISKTQFM